VAPLQIPPADLDRDGDGEGEGHGEQQPPEGVLERPSAEVAKQRGIESSSERRGSIEDEKTSPWEAQRAGAERDGGPSTGNEAADGNQLSAAFAELAIGPGEPPLRLLAAQEAFL
jgi:hypothetical protein